MSWRVWRKQTVYAMRKQVDDKLARLPLKYFDSRPHGEIMSRAVNDMDNISTTLQQSMTQLITSVVTLLGVVVMMLTISPLLTLDRLVTLPLSLLVTMVIAKRSQSYFADQQRALETSMAMSRRCTRDTRSSKLLAVKQNPSTNLTSVNEQVL